MNERKTYRTEEEKRSITNRLNRIEGQIRGINKMVNSDRHCDDIMIQIAAVTKSLKSLGQEILKEHMNTCMVNDIKNNNLETINEVMELFKRLV